MALSFLPVGERLEISFPTNSSPVPHGRGEKVEPDSNSGNYIQNYVRSKYAIRIGWKFMRRNWFMILDKGSECFFRHDSPAPTTLHWGRGGEGRGGEEDFEVLAVSEIPWVPEVFRSRGAGAETTNSVQPSRKDFVE